MFFPFLQSPNQARTTLVVRSKRDPRQMADGGARARCVTWIAGLPSRSTTWTQELDRALFAPRIATISLGVLGVMGAMLAITGHLRDGGLFGEQAAARTGHSHRAGCAASRGVAAPRWDGRFNCWRLGRWRALVLGLPATRVLAFIVYQASPRDPVVLAAWCCSCCCWDCWRRGFRHSGHWRRIR